MSDDEKSIDYDEDNELQSNDDSDIEEHSEEEEEYLSEEEEDKEIEPNKNSQYLEESNEIVNENYNYYDNNNYVEQYHPEEINISFEEMNNLSIITRNDEGEIIDDNHKTFPILSKYEKARIIGLRVSQLNKGVPTFLEVTPNNYIDKTLIAQQELNEKKIPFIIKRPIPNGSFEYWNIKDLEIIN